MSAVLALARRGAGAFPALGRALTAAAAEDLVPATVNGVEVQVPKGSTVLQACDAAGVDIPRFCYHQRLSIAGNCRMCLVEVTKAPKPVASCAMPLMPNMEIKTDTDLVKKAREGVMEFLLINHPLDCPICDQGGECDLQDLAMNYGSDRGRYTDSKRSVVDKNLGPLVKTVMTRCIHCTRCVRFAEEVTGVQDLGVTGRGNASEIGTYVEKLMASELSGNVIDLCPVGALTSKPYAFTARNWELKGVESVDVSDALGCNIRVDTRGTEVMRIVPRLNEDVNEEWISDKARFQYDGLKRQRLNTPLAKNADGALAPVKWEQALAAASEALAASGGAVRAIAGKLADAEAMVALKDLMNRLGAEDTRTEGTIAGVSGDVRSSYVMNSSLVGAEEADAILLIGCNPRAEAPVFNARLRRAVMDRYVPVASIIGGTPDLTYECAHLGAGSAALTKMLSGKGKSKEVKFMETLKQAAKPMVIVGAGMLGRADSAAVMKLVHDLVEAAGIVTEGWNGYNLLHDAAGNVGALDLGFVPSALASGAAPKLVYLLGSDEFDDADVPEDAFVIYQGTHGDKGAMRADLILPGAAFTEKPATFVNTEGRVQQTKRAVPVCGNARDDWKIVRALSEVVGAPLPYDDLDGVRARMAEVAPHLTAVDTIETPLWLNGEYFGAHEAQASGAPSKEPFASAVANFYMTDTISRMSPTMGKCIQTRKEMTHGEGHFSGSGAAGLRQ